MNAMFLVELDATVGSGRRLSDDEITDLIEQIIDDLDGLPVEPSVRTSRVGDDVDFTVGVIIDASEEFEAMSMGAIQMKAAFHAAGIGTAGLELRDLVSRVQPLQPA